MFFYREFDNDYNSTILEFQIGGLNCIFYTMEQGLKVQEYLSHHSKSDFQYRDVAQDNDLYATRSVPVIWYFDVRTLFFSHSANSVLHYVDCRYDEIFQMLVFLESFYEAYLTISISIYVFFLYTYIDLIKNFYWSGM